MTIRQTTSRLTAWMAILAALVFAAAAGCSSPPPQITLEDPYGELSPVFIGAGSLYLKIRNEGGRDALIGATVDLPQTVIELHDVRDNRMVRITKVDVPARKTVELRPGGLHLMVFNLPKAVQSGSELALKLKFDRSGERSVQVRLRKQ